jgi:hypothetical protein
LLRATPAVNPVEGSRGTDATRTMITRPNHSWAGQARRRCGPRRWAVPFLAVLTLGWAPASRTEPETPVHVTVFRKEGRFLGWPANHGLAWSWGNELLVGFLNGVHRDSSTGHAVDKRLPHEIWLARSVDGGLTWQAEHPVAPNTLDPFEKSGAGLAPVETDGAIDFAHADFALVNQVPMLGSTFDPNTDRPGVRGYFQLRAKRAAGRWKDRDRLLLE